MSILDKQGGFDQDHSHPAFYIRFPTLEERLPARDKFARRCLNCGEDLIALETAQKPSCMYQPKLIQMLDLATQQKQEKMAKMAGKTEKVLYGQGKKVPQLL